jgi:hypothetical protein
MLTSQRSEFVLAPVNVDKQDFGLRTRKSDGIVKFSVCFARDTECQSQTFDFIFRSFSFSLAKRTAAKSSCG